MTSVRNWIKKILASCLVMVIGIAIDYVNSVYLHNGWVFILEFIFIIVFITLIIGLFWNNDPEEIILYDDEELEEYPSDERMDAKTYLKKRYIDKEITTEEYTEKMSRL